MLLLDLRYAWRSISKSPALIAVAVACLALGIGINTAIFSVVDGVLIKPVPFLDSDRIVVISGRNEKTGDGDGLSYLDYRDIQEQNTTLVSIAALASRSLTISDSGSDPERYVGSLVSANLFDLLGTPALHGRNFIASDDRPGAERVVLIGYEIWQNRYNGDASIVGRTISVNGRPHAIIGVMPSRFGFPERSSLWIALGPIEHSTPRNVRNLLVLGRLQSDVTVEGASKDMSAVAARLAAAYPSQNANWTAHGEPLSTWLLPAEAYLIILSMMGATTLVLLIACSNVANLLLARASTRQREMSIRAAIGSGRFRIMRQLLAEAVTIGLLSVPPALLVALGALAVLDSSVRWDDIPYYIRWSLDARSFGYGIAVAMVTGMVFGAAPAVHLSKTNLLDGLREGGHGSVTGRRAWLRSGLVVAQVALALILLIGSALFVRSFLNLQGANVGFATAPLMTMRFFLVGDAYEPLDARTRRVHDIVRRVESLAGVQAAFAANFVPLGGGGAGDEVVVAGRPADPGQAPYITRVAATPHLRQTLGVALVRGRDFTDAEGDTKTPVALINEAMAKRLWAGDDPIGRSFRFSYTALPDFFTVIGVVADFRHYQGDSASDAIDPAAYIPLPFEPIVNTGLVIRAAGDPTLVARVAREQIRLSDPALPVFQVFTMEELRQRSFWEYRLFGVMFFLFGAAALVLASIGVYGVLSYWVSQRTQEIGVRVALGAARRDVLRLIVGQGLRLAGIGIVLGLLGAAFITPIVRTLLYNVTPTDPLSFVSVAVFLVCIAAAASYIPARRATAVDAIVAIRNE